MSWVRIWVHLVFCTKNREPFLEKNIRAKVFEHIKANAESKKIWLDCVNGYSEHAHCLISLGRDQSISEVAHLIKGESSFWINKNKLTRSKFMWQDDYWAISVGENRLKDTRNYILNQEAHHSRTTFKQEVDEFMEKYGLDIIADNNQ